MWSKLGETAAIWPGRNWPLGADWSPTWTNFAVYSPNATAMWLCLFDESDVETRYPLTERSLGIWHGGLPDIEPGQRYGYRAESVESRRGPPVQRRQAPARPVRACDLRHDQQRAGPLRL